MARFLDELRHGNWIIYLGKEIAIRDVEMIELCSGVGNPKPIKLTEGWLNTIDGLKNEGYLQTLELTGGSELWFTNGKVYVANYDCPNTNYATEVSAEYVHQLQNLYFALTNKELPFKTLG